MKSFTRKDYGIIFFILAIALLGIWFVTTQLEHYKQTIAQIDTVENMPKKEHFDQYHNQEYLYTQKIKATVKNGKYKGKTIKFTNHYSYSGFYDQRLKVKDHLFVSIKNDGKSVQFLDIKRDQMLLLGLFLFLICLFLIGKRQGIATFFSLLTNIIVMFFVYNSYLKLESLSLIYFSLMLMVLFTVISLVFINGWNKKTGVLIVATIISTFLAFLIALLVLTLENNSGLRFEEMNFLTRPYYGVFLSGILLGALGAVMDVVITIGISLFELKERHYQITTRELHQSGFRIGENIMGAMANILFFTYISEALPTMFLYLRNQMNSYYSFSMALSLEFTRFIVGSIGIVLSVPISIYFCTWMIDRKEIIK